ncbi:hypothetical protein IWW50_002404 [Coemansia erecta]|nr:hypothetical protein IWW50_002404 [Coemansia erecta]
MSDKRMYPDTPLSTPDMEERGFNEPSSRPPPQQQQFGNNGGYPPPQQSSYPPQYNNNGGGYPPPQNQQQFGGNGGYPPSNQYQQQQPPQYNSNGSGYPSQQQQPPQYNNNGGGYPSQQQQPPQYNNNGGGYPSQQQQPPQYNNNGGGYPSQQPQQYNNGEYPSQQQQQQRPPQYSSNDSSCGASSSPPEPIYLPLINSLRPQNGFSQSIPKRIHTLARRPIDSAKWTQFITELNETLHKVPGTLVKGVTNCWLTNLVTLGIAHRAGEMYKDKVFNNAMEVVEKYNRVEFAQFGIRAQLVVVKDEAVVEQECGSHAAHNRMYEKRQHRRERRGEANEATLELVIDRA